MVQISPKERYLASKKFASSLRRISMEPRQQLAANFYTTCKVPSAVDRSSCLVFDKVLVDGGSTICLINGNYARTLGTKGRLIRFQFVKVWQGRIMIRIRETTGL